MYVSNIVLCEQVYVLPSVPPLPIYVNETLTPVLNL